MAYPAPSADQTERERGIIECAASAACVAAEHAARHDSDGTFPVEGLAELARGGYLALSVPEAFGGQGARITEVVLGNLALAKGDASLALVVAMRNAIAVTELAMRLVGGSSLDRSAPLERHYRDVRGGLHHPPQDDTAIALFARDALD